LYVFNITTYPFNNQLTAEPVPEETSGLYGHGAWEDNMRQTAGLKIPGWSLDRDHPMWSL